MPEGESDREAKNRHIVDTLRQAFAPMTERLTSETEPAAIYLVSGQAPEDEE